MMGNVKQVQDDGKVEGVGEGGEEEESFRHINRETRGSGMFQYAARYRRYC